MFIQANNVVEVLQQVTNMVESSLAAAQKKADDAFPKPVALEKYPLQGNFSIPMNRKYSVRLDQSENWYKTRGFWDSWSDITDEESLATRKAALLSKVDEWVAACAEVTKRNEPLIAHNRAIIEKVTLIMQQLGIPDSYSERDTSSRARTPKYVTRAAGYKADLSQNIATGVYGNPFEYDVRNLKARIEEKYAQHVQALRDAALEKKREEGKALRLKKEVFYRFKYCPDNDSASFEDILKVILQKDKYLRLAYYLELNRGDWNDGYSYAKVGLNGFSVKTEEDQEIEDCIRNIVDNFEVDGRYFRDCEFGYGYLYGKVPEDLMKDFTAVRELIGDRQ